MLHEQEGIPSLFTQNIEDSGNPKCRNFTGGVNGERNRSDIWEIGSEIPLFMEGNWPEMSSISYTAGAVWSAEYFWHFLLFKLGIGRGTIHKYNAQIPSGTED